MSQLSNKRHLVFLLAFTLLSMSLAAQTKKDLEAEKQKLQKEIHYTNKLLNETKKNKDLTLDELISLKTKINARSNLIYAINSEMKLINNDISESLNEIKILEKKLAQLKTEYAKIIYYAHKHRSNFDKMMFVLASKDFNQAYKRLKYIQQYSEYRKAQAKEIMVTQLSLKDKIDKLEQIKQEKTVLASIEEQEKQKLAIEKQERESMVKTLQTKEQDLKNKLRKQQKSAKKLQRAIEKIIEEEIRKAREAAKKAGKTSKGFPMTPEALKLSNSFASNKGKLPWPVIQGVITAKFGKHPHPVLDNIVINNNGIDISTSKNAVARAIFDGVVSSVAIIPGEGKVVMIRHGEYLSVYSYITDVYVKKGEQITTKQELGKLVNNSDKSAAHVHLEIWKGLTKLNPQYWIYRK